MNLGPLQIGEGPAWDTAKEFSHRAWLARNGKRLAAQSSNRSASAKGYRLRHARLLLAKLARNELSPAAAAAVRRDYAKEFKRLEG